MSELLASLPESAVQAEPMVILELVIDSANRQAGVFASEQYKAAGGKLDTENSVLRLARYRLDFLHQSDRCGAKALRLAEDLLADPGRFSDNTDALLCQRIVRDCFTEAIFSAHRNNELAQSLPRIEQLMQEFMYQYEGHPTMGFIVPLTADSLSDQVAEPYLFRMLDPSLHPENNWVPFNTDDCNWLAVQSWRFAGQALRGRIGEVIDKALAV